MSSSLDERKAPAADTFNLKVALKNKTRVQARAHVGKWRDGTTMLGHHINAQMEFCKELRNSETLKQMLEEDPAVRDRKRLAKFVDSMKADIRTLHNDICERVLGKPPRVALSVKELQKQAASGGGAHRAFGAASTNTWQQRTLTLEEQLAEYSISAEGGDFGSQRLVELADMRQRLIVELADFLVAKKNALDSSLGITVDIAKTVDDEDPVMKASRDVRAFLRIIQAFVDMTQLIKQANMSVDGARHGKAIAKLQKRQVTLNEQLAMANARVAELEEAVEVLRQGQGGQKVSQQALKLDEAVTRMRLLEKQDAALRNANAAIASRNGELEDMVVRLEETLAEAKRQHEVETSCRAVQLEANVEAALATMQTVQMDVELLASMYKSGVDELEAMQGKVDDANKERNVMAAKLHAELRQVVGLRNELRRKDNIAIKLNAARRSWMESYNKAKDATAAAEARRDEYAATVARHEGTIADMTARIAGLQEDLGASRAETAQAQAERDEARASLKLAKLKKKEIATELDVMTSKVVAAGLDEAGQTRYEQLQAKFADALRMHSVFESQLERSHAETAGAKKEVERLRVLLTREGIDPDDADV